ncbi:MAG: TrbI/VirB10 family protein [Pseudomonadota bacterium]
MSSAPTQEQLAIRAKPRPVKRFNKAVLISSVAVVTILVIGAAAYALRPPGAREAQAQELYNTTNKPMPDAFNALPASYADVVTNAQPVKLGPPLPGDLGAPFLGQQAVVATTDNPFRFEPTALPANPAGQGSQALAEVRASKLFFIESKAGNTRSVESASTAERIDPGLAAFDQLAALLPQQAAAPQLSDPNRQDRKEAFVSAAVDQDIYNPHSLQVPVSPYQVMAGTIIPASLITGLNSDLPGQVIAQVTEHVYDSATGQYVLVPQGTRLLGRYDSVIAFGQSRALMVWTRLILPDGTSVQIDNLPGTDLSGYSGLKDKLDRHGWQLFKAAALSSILAVGTEIGRDRGQDEIFQALRDGGQLTLNQAGQEIVTRQLGVQPTITVRPGWRLRVIVNQDLVLTPYGG